MMMGSLVMLAASSLGFGGQVPLATDEVRCRLSNGWIVELLPSEKANEFHLLVVDGEGEIIDPTWLRVEDGKIVEMETNGGIGSREAVAKQFRELRTLPRSSVANAPRCREPMKDGTR
jgi:hypothetical protein